MYYLFNASTHKFVQPIDVLLNLDYLLVKSIHHEMDYFEVGLEKTGSGLVPGFYVFEERLQLEVLGFRKSESRFKSIHS